MRGILSSMTENVYLYRITPAHAGNTLKKPQKSTGFPPVILTIHLVQKKSYMSAYNPSVPYADP